jgi:hypothetical protein
MEDGCLLHHQRTCIHLQARIRSELVPSYGVELIQYQDSDTRIWTRGDKQYVRQAPHARWGNPIDFLPPLRRGNCNNSRSSYCQWDREVSQPEIVGMHLPACNDALPSQHIGVGTAINTWAQGHILIDMLLR